MPKGESESYSVKSHNTLVLMTLISWLNCANENNELRSP